MVLAGAVLVRPAGPPLEAGPPRQLEGSCPGWKGTFWPTVISPSVLWVMIACGVEMTFTSLELCSALSTMENEGTLMPATVMAGPWMPARKPPRDASELMPPSDER